MIKAVMWEACVLCMPVCMYLTSLHSVLDASFWNRYTVRSFDFVLPRKDERIRRQLKGFQVFERFPRQLKALSNEAGRLKLAGSRHQRHQGIPATGTRLSQRHVHGM